MTEIHIWVGVALVSSSLVAAAWGGAAYWRSHPSIGFWYVLRAVQLLVVAQVVIGGVLLLGGREPSGGLHYVYGLLPLLVSFFGEGARVGVSARELEGLDYEALPAARRDEIALAIAHSETGIMALSALVIFGLSLRAALGG